MTLDDLIPSPDWRMRHARAIAAPPEAALAAARAVTIRDMPLAALLLAVRGFGRLPAIPFVELLERRVGLKRFGEDLWGGLLTPWRLTGGSRRVDDLAGFSEPGWVKVAVNLEAADAVLSTETRIAATSEDARRAFGRYWRIVGVGSGLVRASWLRAAERRVSVGSP